MSALYHRELLCSMISSSVMKKYYHFLTEHSPYTFQPSMEGIRGPDHCSFLPVFNILIDETHAHAFITNCTTLLSRYKVINTFCTFIVKLERV